MLNDVTFADELAKSAYRTQRDELKRRLMVLQQKAIQAGLGTVVIFEGWDAAGKGSRISDLVVDLDPRAYRVHTMEGPVGYESRLPFMQRYWSRLGRHGDMTIFDQAYYDELSRMYIEDVRLGGDPSRTPAQRDASIAHAEKSIRGHIESARSFERQVEADGYLIVRFFLHIPRDVQRSRIMDVIADAASSWKVNARDLVQMQNYELYEKVFNRWLFEEGSSEWQIIPAMYRRNANIQIMQTLVNKIEAALIARGHNPDEPIEAYPTAYATPKDNDECDEETRLQRELELAKKRTGSAKKIKSRFKLQDVPTLKEVRSSQHVISSDAEYKRLLKEQQDRLSQLTIDMYRKRVPCIIAYEGWDAAGKGGNIKRLTSAMDARSYEVQPISAPSKDELAHPFLWRFWTRLPRDGHTAIFDRTWYGRVLVERIEGFATEEEWRRAYDEINEFEDDLRAWGAVLVKFWVDVTPDEQLRRFKDRENDPDRRWKITPDDWRNRAKNDLYYTCIEDMMRLTSTKYAPWHIVSSDDKHFARVQALKIVNNALEERLKL